MMTLPVCASCAEKVAVLRELSTDAESFGVAFEPLGKLEFIEPTMGARCACGWWWLLVPEPPLAGKERN